MNQPHTSTMTKKRNTPTADSAKNGKGGGENGITMAWQTILLGNVLTFQRGFDITKNEQSDGPFPVISSSGAKSSHTNFKVRGPGVIIGRKGSLGTVFFSDGDYWPHSTTLYVKDFHGNDPKFAYYFLQTMDFKRLDVGASNPSLNRNHIHPIPVLWPPLPTQKRIAGILSAYDDLIENCQRRISILENMARGLYREWFVHFRFPGHEGHPRVNSPLGEIPEGWEVRAFSAIAHYINGYAFKPSDWSADGVPIIKIKELKAGITADTPRNSGEGIPEKYRISDGCVLFSWSADLDTYLWAGGQGLLNQHLFNVVPFDAISLSYCFHALKESMPQFRALSIGATMHHIKRSALDQVFLALPPKQMRKSFEALVEPVHLQIINLTKHIQTLRRTRNVLLPRLLSGQIEVGEGEE